MMPYQRHISAAGSRPRAAARAKASFFVKPRFLVFANQRSLWPNSRAARKRARDSQTDANVCDSVHRKPGALRFFSLLFTQQLCQLCYHSLGKSQGWHTNTPRLRKCLWNPASEKSLRPLQPHGSISAMRQLLVPMLLVRRGCHQHLRRVHNKSRKHYRDLQKTLLRRGNSTNAAPLYRTAYRMEHRQH